MHWVHVKLWQNFEILLQLFSAILLGPKPETTMIQISNTGITTNPPLPAILGKSIYRVGMGLLTL